MSGLMALRRVVVSAIPGGSHDCSDHPSGRTIAIPLRHLPRCHGLHGAARRLRRGPQVCRTRRSCTSGIQGVFVTVCGRGAIRHLATGLAAGCAAQGVMVGDVPGTGARRAGGTAEHRQSNNRPVLPELHGCPCASAAGHRGISPHPVHGSCGLQERGGIDGCIIGLTSGWHGGRAEGERICHQQQLLAAVRCLLGARPLGPHRQYGP